MIVILGHPELDTKVSDAGMETTESNDCRVMSRNNGNANSVLAITHEGVRFSYKDRWKFINLFIQSISGLCQRVRPINRQKIPVDTRGFNVLLFGTTVATFR